MREKILKEKRLLTIGGIFFLWVLGLQLLTTIGGRTDDTYFAMVGNAPDFTYMQWIQDMWFGWSSRLIINCLCVFFATSPYIIWRIINALLIAIVPLLLWKLTEACAADKEKMAILACTLFMMMPYIITGEAGWIATSVNYVLPAACLLICAHLIWKVMDDRSITIWEGVGYFAAACIATDSEQGSFCMAALFVAGGFRMFYDKKKKYRKAIWGLALFSLLRMTVMFICPGNIVRKGLIIKENYPEFGDFGFFDKFLAGIYSVASDTFLVFFALTFIMLLLITMLVWKKYKTWYKRCISVIPLACSIIFPAAVCMLIYKDYTIHGQIGGDWGSSIKNVMSIMGISGNFNNIWYTLPLAFYGMIVCLFICIFLSLWWILEGSSKYITVMVFMMGCCTKGAMGFTGTVWLSHSRTGYYMVLAEMFVILQLFGRWRQMEHNRMQSVYLWLTAFLACMNSIVSYGTAILYAKI